VTRIGQSHHLEKNITSIIDRIEAVVEVERHELTKKNDNHFHFSFKCVSLTSVVKIGCNKL